MSQTQMLCFKCGQPIAFKKGVVNKWGKPQQLNLDGTEHWKTCTARAQNNNNNSAGSSSGTAVDTTEIRVIVELLQLINGKLDVILANNGIKQVGEA